MGRHRATATRDTVARTPVSRIRARIVGAVLVAGGAGALVLFAGAVAHAATDDVVPTAVECTVTSEQLNLDPSGPLEACGVPTDDAGDAAGAPQSANEQTPADESATEAPATADTAVAEDPVVDEPVAEAPPGAEPQADSSWDGAATWEDTPVRDDEPANHDEPTTWDGSTTWEDVPVASPAEELPVVEAPAQDEPAAEAAPGEPAPTDPPPTDSTPTDSTPAVPLEVLVVDAAAETSSDEAAGTAVEAAPDTDQGSVSGVSSDDAVADAPAQDVEPVTVSAADAAATTTDPASATTDAATPVDAVAASPETPADPTPVEATPADAATPDGGELSASTGTETLPPSAAETTSGAQGSPADYASGVGADVIGVEAPHVITEDVPRAGPGPFPAPPPCSGVEVRGTNAGPPAPDGTPTVLTYDAEGNLRAVSVDGSPSRGAGSSGSPQGPLNLPDPLGGPLPGVPAAPGPVVNGGSGSSSGHGHELAASTVSPGNVAVTGPRDSSPEGELITPRERANGVDDHPG